MSSLLVKKYEEAVLCIAPGKWNLGLNFRFNISGSEDVGDVLSSGTDNLFRPDSAHVKTGDRVRQHWIRSLQGERDTLRRAGS